jgi:Methyltransferase small domain
MTDSRDFLLDDADIPALQHCLARIAASEYSEAAVRDRLGLKDLCDLQMRAAPLYRGERLAKRRPLDTAIDLFLLQGTIGAAELDCLLDKEDVGFLERTGVLRIESTGDATANVSLYPAGNQLIFSDHAWPQLSKAGSSAVPFGQVMFVGADSRWLARATVRSPVSSALDLCTGSGVQALLAATHCRRVAAVDINSRAVRCTRFNAKALGCGNLEVFEGDLYEPVGKEKFDLITANPPFVPSPVNSIGFRDGGRTGEDVQRRIVAGLSDHLAQGGMAQMVTEIGERDTVPLADRVREWLGSAPIDIHVLRLRIHSAEAYAIGHASGDTPGEFLGSVDAWADNLRLQGFTRIVSVLLAFQWSDPLCGPPWNRVDEAYPPSRDAGKEIEAAFAAERLTRDPGLKEKLKLGRVNRTGPVILQEGRVLGGTVPLSCKATLSGQAIPVEYRLNPIERGLLDAIDNPVYVPTLLKIARQINVSESSLLAGLASLLRERLIGLQES